MTNTNNTVSVDTNQEAVQDQWEQDRREEWDTIHDVDDDNPLDGEAQIKIDEMMCCARLRQASEEQ
jgi:hypothetical protein